MKTPTLLLALLLAIAPKVSPASALGPEGAELTALASKGAGGGAVAARGADAAPRRVSSPSKPGAGPAAAVKRAPAKAPAGSNKKGQRAKKPCLAKPVQLVRVRGEVVEPRELSLTTCNGAPNMNAVEALSVLARPRDVDRPSPSELKAYKARPVRKGKVAKKSKQKFRDPQFVTDRVMRVHPGLLVRLQRIANRYPGRLIEIISGYRPDARLTSRHHHGRALDLRVSGVTREKLRDFLRGFDETGVGYYPNSFFVHMDVRDQKGYWVDRSGPGEPADYGPWPPKKDELDHTRDAILKRAFADLAELKWPSSKDDQRTAMAQPTVKKRVSSVRAPVHEQDDMSEQEIAEVRAEARRALEQL